MTYQAAMPRDIESARLTGRSRLRPDVMLCAVALLGSVSAGACLMRVPAWISASAITRPSSAAVSMPARQLPTVAAAKANVSTGTVLAPMQPLRRLAKVEPPTRTADATPPSNANAQAVGGVTLPAPALSTMPVQALAALATTVIPAQNASSAPASVVAAPASVVATPASAVAIQPAPLVVADAAPLRPALEAPVADAVEPDASVSIPAVTALEHDIPLPVRRPSRLASLETAPPSTVAVPRRVAATREAAPARVAAQPAAAPTGQADGNSFFDKLFKPQPQAAAPALAYATPESQSSGLFSWLGGSKPRAVASDRQTAVYDISTHTVTLPDGTQLEAHSGYGEAKDDPASVAQRMRGVTPPNMYDLRPREALFHGVRALRMTPIGSGSTYGRAGLLTHSYMLRGREGESNGCVVFRNYEAFLRAYETGQVRRLLVVSRAS